MSPLQQKLLDTWFVQEIVPLEHLLVGYLRKNTRDPDSVADLRQDIYVKVYEAAEKEIPLLAKPFLFAVARNLLIDRARQSQVASIVALGLPDSDDYVDELSPERHALARESLGCFARALAALPPRCREVVELRKIAGLSQRAVAQQLGISEGSVEKQIAKGVRCLADAMSLTTPAPVDEAETKRQSRSRGKFA
ncbi:MAG: RNA polymerase sigma factor [Pseudomonadota bacterium]